MQVFKIKYDLERGFRGILIEDLISETAESFLKDKGRNWNMTDFPDFKKQFLSALDSHLYNSIKKELGKHIDTELFPENDTTKAADDSSYKQDLSILTDILIALGASDDELLIFEPYYIHKMKREEIATLMDKSVTEVSNIKKQLDRKLPILRSEFIRLSDER
ncbi:MAG: hypothetical protein HWE21_10985 [Cytophagia bacterium]|nr:hypothetical protein [Cytophagia bacterium]